MNYWLLTTEFPPFYGGGIATYCVNTVAMLTQYGHAVTVITPSSNQKEPITIEDSKTHRVVRFDPYHEIVTRYAGYFAGLSYRFAEVAEYLIASGNTPHCIEAQDYQGIAYYLQQFKLLKQGLLTQVPIVITLHSPAYVYLDINRVPLYKFPEYQICEMEKASIVAADLVIAPTQYMCSVATEKIPKALQNVAIIANPFEPEWPSLGMTQFKKNKIVFYGKLSLQKGVVSLLNYFKEIWETKSLELVLVGGTDIFYYPEMSTMGSYVKSRFKRYIDDGRLIIRDKIAPTDLKIEMSDAHLIVIPSVVDNLPYALLETMSLGKVVLVSKQGGQSEVVRNGENGFVFDHNIERDFAETLAKILSLDPSVLNQIGENAAVSVRSSFSFEKIYSQKMETLTRLTASSTVANTFPFLYQEPTNLTISAGQQACLSIVIPYYNMGSYLVDTLDSIKSSGYADKEIIIVDDGSDDVQSIQLLDTVEKTYQCKIIHTRNQGLAEARNVGAKHASGHFLAFLDPDDKVMPDYYEKAIAVLSGFSNVYAVGCFVKYFEKKTSYWITTTPQPPYILAHNSVNSSALVYKKMAFLEAGLNDKSVDYGLEDYESVIHMVSKGFNIVVLPEVLFHYRVRNNSMFRNINRNKFLYSYKYIAGKHSWYFQKHAIELLHLQNANGPGYMYDSSGFERRVFSIRTVRSLLEKTIPKNSVIYKLAKNIYSFILKK